MFCCHRVCCVLLRAVVWFLCIDTLYSDVTTLEPSLEPCDSLSLDCDSLDVGQYYCADPVIDASTQREEGCSKSHPYVEVDCFPVSGICCNGRLHSGSSVGFRRRVPCNWTSGKKFNVALLLSIFVGWLGIDRFYLGYPALGLLKLCTFGFMLIWTLIDVLLIALQIVGPADGSEYVIDFYGPGVTRVVSDNMTYIVPPGSTV